tara:strand:- start:9433 stop:12651 length:3219 start_codon:yes stop_codon:yes gene_type:complete
MNKHFLENIYREILNEAILDQTTFLKKLVSIANKKEEKIRDSIENNEESDKVSFGLITNKIKELTKSTNLFDLTGSENKKARKAAELRIHKKLKKIKGINDTPIDLKLIRPFYDSIIRFLQEKKDLPVDLIDDAIKVSDYYMKEFYTIADKKEKEIIDKGKFDLKIIFRRTKFYQRYLKSNYGNKKLDITIIYEDNNIAVVYPKTSESFNRYIASKTANEIDWCTQTPGTWVNYNTKQHVMIVHNKTVPDGHEDYLISLKVKFDGSIDAPATCDYKNDHMHDRLYNTLNDSAIIAIKRRVASGNIGVELSTEEALENSKRLVDLNETTEFKKIIHVLAIVNSNDPQTGFNYVTKEIFKYAISKQKFDKVLDVYVEVLSDLSFDNLIGEDDKEGRLEWEYPLNLESEGLSIDKSKKMIAARLLKLSLKKHTHEKYFVTLIRLFNVSLFSYIKTFGDPVENIIASMKNAIRTNINVSFKKIINLCIKNHDIKNLLTNDHILKDVITSQGFASVLAHKNLDVINSSYSEYYSENKDKFGTREYPISDADEYLTIAILRNKETFTNVVEKSKNKFSIDDLDRKTIIEFLVKEIRSYKDLQNLNVNPLSQSLFNADYKEVENIFEEFINDIDFFKYYDKDDELFEYFWMYFCEKNFILKNTELHNEKSYALFSYILKKLYRKNYRWLSDSLKNSNYLKSEEASENEYVKAFGVLSYLLKNCFKINYNNYNQVEYNVMYSLASDWYFLNPNDWSNYSYGIFINNFNLFKSFSEGSGQIKENILKFLKSISIKLELSSSNDINLLKNTVKKLLTIPSVKNEILEYFNRHTKYLYLSDFVLLFFMHDNNLLGKENKNKLFVGYINFLNRGQSYIKQQIEQDYSQGYRQDIKKSVYELSESDIESILVKFNNKIYNAYVPTNKSTKFLGRTCLASRDDFFYESNKHLRYLIFLLIKKCNENNICFDKKSIKEITDLESFSKKADALFKEELFKNFITLSSNNVENKLEMKDRAFVRDALVFGLRKGSKHLINDYDLILRFVKQLDNISKRHMYLAFPNEKDLNKIELDEALLKLYLRLLIS